MGSITLDRDGTSVTLTHGLSVTRQVGRPAAQLRPKPDSLPNYVDKPRAASDIWEISGAFTSSTAEADAETLSETIIRDPLGRGDLTLTFDDSLFGLGTYAVFPEGAQSSRITYSAGETGIVSVEKLALRVVNNG